MNAGQSRALAGVENHRSRVLTQRLPNASAQKTARTAGGEDGLAVPVAQPERKVNGLHGYQMLLGKA